VPEVSLPILLYAGAALMLAGFVKGFIGLGMPTTATGLLTIMLTPIQAAALLVVPNVATNLWQAFAGKRLRPLLQRFWPMVLGIVLGSAPGAGILAHDTSGLTTTVLGVLLCLYAVFALLSPKFRVPPEMEWWLGPLAGALTGWLAVLTGVFVVPLGPYLNALSLERDELIQALGLSLLTSAVSIGVALARENALPVVALGASMAALAPAGLGLLLGQWLRQRSSPALFVRVFALALLAIGLHLAMRDLL
jgi:uncharacterized membrane protein YfcA